MFRQIPNALTASRLFLAIVFFVMLSFYQYKGRGDLPDRWLLHWAFLTYVIVLGRRAAAAGLSADIAEAPEVAPATG